MTMQFKHIRARAEKRKGAKVLESLIPEAASNKALAKIGDDAFARARAILSKHSAAAR